MMKQTHVQKFKAKRDADIIASYNNAAPRKKKKEARRLAKHHNICLKTVFNVIYKGRENEIK